MMVQIRNKMLNLYDKKGSGAAWTDKMHQRGSWSNLGAAKAHVGFVCFGTGSLDVNAIRKYLVSEFISIDEEYKTTAEPVAIYMLEKIAKELKQLSSYYKERYARELKELEQVLVEAEQMMKEADIQLN